MKKVNTEYHCDSCSKKITEEEALKQPEGKQLCKKCAEMDGWRPFKSMDEFIAAGGLDWWFVECGYKNSASRITSYKKGAGEYPGDNDRVNMDGASNFHDFLYLFHHQRRVNPLTNELSIIGVKEVVNENI